MAFERYLTEIVATVRTQSLNLIRNKDKMQPRPSCMVRSIGKTNRQIDILMFDSPVPLSGLAKIKIWWNFWIVLSSKLQWYVRQTTILTETVDKSYAQRHTAGSRDKTDNKIDTVMVATHPPVYDRAMAKI